MTARGVDVEKSVDEPGDGWFGMAQPHAAAHAGPNDESVDTDRRSIRDVERPAAESWESRPSTSGGWDFTASSGSAWHPSKVPLIVAAVMVAAAGVVGIVLLLGGASGAEDPPLVVPSSPLSPASSVPAVSSQPPLRPPPPVGPPPAPPPSTEQMNPPIIRHYTPSYQTPDPTQKPQIDVTRAPMSAAPPAVSKIPERNSATPGDARRHGLFG